MAIMAWLLLCLISGVSMTGCLIPQDDQVLPELPPVKNRPPRIETYTPSSVSVTFRANLACSTRPDFSLVVSDPDVGDTLRSFWFIDKTTSTQPFQPATIPGTASVRRVVTAPNSNTFTTALANLMSGTHLLTVYVTDRDVEEIDNGLVKAKDTQVTLPDGSTAIDDGYEVEHTWILNVEPCP